MVSPPRIALLEQERQRHDGFHRYARGRFEAETRYCGLPDQWHQRLYVRNKKYTPECGALS